MSLQRQMEDVLETVILPKSKTQIEETAKSQGIKIDQADSTEIDHKELNKILVPTTMNKLQAAWNLVREFQEEETYKAFHKVYDNRFVNDFVSTANKIAKEEFGAIITSPINTEGKSANNTDLDIPLKYVGKKIVSETAFLGSIVAAPWESAIIDIGPSSISVRAKTKYTARVNAFLRKIEIKLNSESVIKGSAVEIYTTDMGVFTKPVYVKVNDGIFLKDKTERVISNLVIPSLNEKRKKAILLTGDFGTGKTETAIRIGASGQERFGRTFFYLKNAQMFNVLLPFLKNYQGSTVFVEDIDQIVDGERTTELNNLLNSIDGAELKNSDTTFLFTTNAHDKINPAMRRPGRIDEVIHFDYCDYTMVEQIYKHRLADLKGAADIDFAEAARYTPEELQGAIVSEIADRAKKYSNNLHNGVLSTDVLKDAIASMEHHIRFMRATPDKDKTLETAAAIVGEALAAGVE